MRVCVCVCERGIRERETHTHTETKTVLCAWSFFVSLPSELCVHNGVTWLYRNLMLKEDWKKLGYSDLAQANDTATANNNNTSWCKCVNRRAQLQWEKNNQNVGGRGGGGEMIKIIPGLKKSILIYNTQILGQLCRDCETLSECNYSKCGCLCWCEICSCFAGWEMFPKISERERSGHDYYLHVYIQTLYILKQYVLAHTQIPQRLNKIGNTSFGAFFSFFICIKSLHYTYIRMIIKWKWLFSNALTWDNFWAEKLQRKTHTSQGQKKTSLLPSLCNHYPSPAEQWTDIACQLSLHWFRNLLQQPCFNSSDYETPLNIQSGLHSSLWARCVTDQNQWFEQLPCSVIDWFLLVKHSSPLHTHKHTTCTHTPLPYMHIPHPTHTDLSLTYIHLIHTHTCACARMPPSPPTHTPYPYTHTHRCMYMYTHAYPHILRTITVSSTWAMCLSCALGWPHPHRWCVWSYHPPGSRCHHWAENDNDTKVINGNAIQCWWWLFLCLRGF